MSDRNRNRPARVVGVSLLVALQAVVVVGVIPQLSSPAEAAEVDLTGAWAGSTAGPWSASTPIGLDVTAVATSPTGGAFAFSGTQALENPFNGQVDYPYASDYVPGHESFAFVANWPASLTSDPPGTLTFTFSEPVVDPILHLDRLGGTEAGGISNSSVFELVTPGTMTKLSGVDHLAVTPTTFVRTVGETLDPSATASCSDDSRFGTACGSIQISGVFTEIVFNWSGAGTAIAAGDGVEFTWEITGVPEVSFIKSSDATAPLVDGDVVNYQIDVVNTASTPIAGISIDDVLPNGLVYVPNSTVVVYDSSTSTQASLFLDTFEGGLTPWNQDDNGDTNDDVNTASDAGSTRLHIQDRDAGAWRSIGDLTPYDSAIVTFDFRRVGLEAGDSIDVYASSDVSGVSATNANCSTSSSWTQIGNIPRLQQTDPSYQTGTFVIPAEFLTSNPGICFFTPSTLTDTDDFYFDNVQVIGTTTSSSTTTLDNDPDTATPPLSDGTPGALVTAGDAITLSADNTITVTYQAVVDTSLLPPGATAITNEATFTAPSYPLPAPTSSVTDALAVADLRLVKTDSGPVLPDGQVTYTITVVNAGPTAAVNAVVDDTPDANLIIDSVTPSQGSCTAFPCALGDIADGGTATITVVATPGPSAPITGAVDADATEPGVGDCGGADLCNVASVSSDSLDWDTSDNADDEPTDVIAPVVEVDKVASAPTDNGDGTFDVDYTVSISNSGTAPGAYDITDTLVTAPGISAAVVTAPVYDAGASTDSTAETPGALPALITGGSIDVGGVDVVNYTIRYTVDPTAPVPDPCSDLAGTHAADNSATSSTGATDAACVDLAVPRLELTKSLGGYDDNDADGQVSAGDEMNFEFLVENTGNTSIDSIDLQDANPAVVVSCPATTLAVGGSITCTGTYAVTPGDVDAAQVINTASVTGTSAGGVLPLVPDSAVTTPINQNPSIRLTKTNITGSGPFVENDVITYRFDVENTGDVTLANVVLTDPLLPGATFTCSATLAIGASTTCDVAYTVTQQDIDDGQIANSAAVSAESPLAVPVSDTDGELSVLLQSPQIDLVKSHDTAPTIDADASGAISAGDTITYRFDVSNTGNVTLDTLVVDDPLTGPAACAATLLVPGDSTTCSVTYVVTDADSAAGAILNTATATASSPAGATATDSDSDTTPVAAPPSISVSKGLVGINGATGTFLDTWEAGDTLDYEFVVTNTGGVTLDPVGITDTVIASADISCPVTSLAPGASAICTGSHIVSQGEFDVGTITNTVTATGAAPNGDEFTDTASHVADTTQRVPDIAVSKSVSGTAEAGATLTYSFAVTNVGNVRLNSVGVTDDLLATAPTCVSTLLDPGQSTTCTGTYVVQPADVEAGVIDNTATATASPVGGLPDVSAQDSISTPVAQNPSIDLDKSNSITTDVAPAGVLSVGDTITYVIVITNDGDVELTGVTFTDDQLGFTDAAIDAGPCDGADATLAPDEFVTCTGTHVVTQPDVDAGIVSNNASATGASGSGATPTATGSTSIVAAQSPGIQTDKLLANRVDVDGTGDDSAGDTFEYAVAVTNTGNVTLDPVSVTDARLGLTSVPIDDARCASDGTGTALAPGETATCTFAYSLTQTDVDDGSIQNTATGSGQPPAGLDPVTDTSSVSTTIQPTASIDLVKTLDAQSSDPIVVDTVLTYRFTVTNTGNTTISSVTVDDSLLGGPITCPATILPGASGSCTAPYTVLQSDVDAGSVVNTATASGQPPTPLGGPVPTPVSSTPSIVTTPIPQLSSITIDKSATTVPDPLVDGSVIEYTFTIENTGSVTVTDIEVDDSLIGVFPCVASLDPEQIGICTAQYTVTQADVDAGEVVNAATATGDVPPGAPPLDPTPPSVVATPIPSDPNWTFVKALASNDDADASLDVSLDDVLTFSFTVTNTGNVTISAIAIDDPIAGTVLCPVTELAPGEDVVCSADYLVTQSDVDAGQVVNSATVSGSVPSASDPLPVLPPSVVTTPITAAASITLTKSLQSTNDVDGDARVATGDVLTFAFRVTNTGNVTLDPIVVNDPLVTAVSCPETSLAPGAFTICTGAHIVLQGDVDAGSFVNTATASGQPPTPSGGAVPPVVESLESSVVTPLSQFADIAVTKSYSSNADGDGSGSVTLGDELTFTVVIENTGTVTLDPVTFTDARVGVIDGTCGVAALAAGASTSCDVVVTVTQSDVDAGSVTNVVDVAGTPPAGSGLAPVGDTDNEVVPVTQLTEMTLDKSSSVADADGDGLTEPGDVVTYTFTATNSGTTVLSSASISDALPGLSALACTPAQPVDLGPGETLVCTATVSITQTDVDAGRIDNTATATGTPPVGAPPLVSPTATDIVSIDRVPSIDVAKSITGGPVAPGVGDTIEYTFTIANTGNVTLDPVVLNDAQVGFVDATCGVDGLAAGQLTTCVAPYVVTQDDVDAGVIRNTATVTGTPPPGLDDVNDTDTLDQILSQNPSITLAKTVVNNDDIADGELSENDTLTYTFDIVNDGDVTLTVVTLSDALANLGTISCTSALPADFAPGDSTTCTADYTVTAGDVAAGQVVNDATVTGNPPIGPPVQSTDQKIVTVTESPSIGLTKSAVLPDADPSVDDVVVFEFLVTNTGNVSLDSVSVSDVSLPGLSPIDCGGVTTLAIGAGITCTATYAITQADIDGGVVQNTAEATGTSPTGELVIDDDDERIVPNQEPDVTITKGLAGNADEDASGSVTANDTLTYSITITNSGNVTLTSVTYSDARLGLTDIACNGVTTLLPGESTLCSVDYVVSQADVDAGPIINTATTTATPPIGPDVTSTDGETVVPAQVGVLDLDKGVASNDDADGSSSVSVDDTLTYEFVVTNVGSVTISGIAVSDPRIGSVDCPDTTAGVAPGVSITCDATYVVTQADLDSGSIVNTATATGTPPVGVAAVPPATDSVTTTIDRQPALTLVKSSDSSTIPSVGDIITYTFSLENAGNVSLDPVVVTDPLPGLAPIDCGGVTALAPGDTLDCTAAYTVTQDDVDNGRIVNVVTATATPPVGLAELVETDELTVPIVQNPRIALTKTADPTADPAVGDVIEFTFLVTNPGTVTLDPVVVTDGLAGVTTPDCDNSALAPGGIVTCQAFLSVTQDDIDAGSITNAASATGTAPDGVTTVTALDAVSIAIASNPAIDLQKVLAGNADEDGSNSVSFGDTLTFQFDITNTGDVTLDPVVYSDPLLGLTDVSCGAVASLAPLATTTCTAVYVVTQADVDAGEITNNASATGTSPTGDDVTDSATVVTPVEQVAATTLTKSASHVDADLDALVDVGETIDYTLVFTNTGTVTVTDALISDPLLSTLVCDQAAPVTLAPGGALTCTGSATVLQADVDAGRVVNTATASATPPPDFTGALPDATDDAIVPIDRIAGIDLLKSVVNNDADPASVGDSLTYTLSIENTGNVRLDDVTLTDPFPFLAAPECDGGAVVLPATLDPGQSVVCTADYVVVQTDVDAGLIENTATVDAQPPAGLDPVTDSETVSLVLPQNPSLTLTKTATVTDGTFDDTDDTIDFEFVIANDGDVTLTVVDLIDALEGNAQFSPIDCGAATLPLTLDPGDVVTCTAIYDVEQPDLDAGQVANTATATGNPPAGLPPVDSTDTAVVTVDGSPSINLTKSAIAPVPAVVESPADDVTYAFVITNDGNLTLTDVALDDPKIFPSGPVLLSTLPCVPAQPDNILDPGEAVTCEVTYDVVQGDIDAGEVRNSATISGQPPTPVGGVQPPLVSDVDAELIVTPQRVGIAVDKAFTNNADEDLSLGVSADDTLTYTFTITNTGNVTLQGVTVADAIVGIDPAVAVSTLLCDVDVSDDQLAPGEVVQCSVTYVVQQDDVDAGEIVNTVTVTGTPPIGVTVTDVDIETVAPAQATSFALDKRPPTNADGDGSLTVSLDDVLTYTFDVVNTGTVTLSGIDVTDSLGITVDCPATVLAPGASMLCDADYPVLQDDVDRGEIVNTATAVATPPVGAPPVDPVDDTVVTEVPQSPLLTLTKARTDTTDPIRDTSTLTYELIATNVGNVTLSDVTVTDSLDPSLTCVPGQPATLAPGASVTCDAAYPVTQSDVDAGRVVNTANASATPPPGAPVVPPVPAVVVTTPIPATPSLALAKSATPPATIAVGDTLVYSFEVTNDGNVSVSDVRIDDPTLGLVGYACFFGPLAPGDSDSCTYEATVTQTDIDAGQIVNVATANGQPPTPGGEPVPPRVTSPTSQVTTPLPPDAAISIDKTSDVTSTPVLGQVITYRFFVVNEGNVTLDPVVVTDPLPGLSSVDCGAVASLAPAASLTCTATYAVTQPDIDAGTIVNTARVEGQPPTRPDATVPPVVFDEDAETTDIAADPQLEATKSLESYVSNGDGTYVVTFRIAVSNTGNVTMDDVAVFDDIATQFAAANVIAGSTTATDASFIADPSWDGSATSNVLAAGQSLAPDETSDVVVSFVIAPTSDLTLANVASAVGTPPDGTPIAPVESPPVEVVIDVEVGSISGVAFDDVNGDGLYTSGVDVLLVGVEVVLTGTNAAGDDVDITVTTGPSGTYIFPGLVPGDYLVTETQPVGLLDGSESVDGVLVAASAGGPDAVPVALGTNQDTTVDFAELQPGSLAGAVTDSDGSPIAGVTVTLSGTDDLGNLIDIDVLTDADGAYEFSGLRPGTYVLTETQPAGYGAGSATTGTGDGVFDGAVNGPDTIEAIVLAPGEDGTGYDFVDTIGSLAGQVFTDVDGDGLYTEGVDLPIAGVTITLTGTDVDGPIAPVDVVTGIDGTYVFPALLAGDYTIVETQPTGYDDGPDTIGTLGGDGAVNDTFSAIPVGGGENGTGYLFAEAPSGSIAGTVTDSAGSPIAGVTLTLTGTDLAGNTVTAQVDTNPDGTYSFDGLPAGTYSLTETQPVGYGDGTSVAGTSGGVDGVNTITDITIGATDAATGYDFVEQLGSLSGKVFQDTDANQVQAIGEPGLAGVTLRLIGTDVTGAVVDRTTVTLADGSYTFADLVGGTYSITETQPPAYVDGPDVVGSLGGTLTAPDSIDAIVLDGGIDGTGYVFTEVGQTIGGTVYVDRDRDGRADAGEPRLAGVTITLLGADGAVIARTETGADGGYVFVGLPAGDYTVVESQPDGLGSTTPNRVPVALTPAAAAVVDFGESVSSIAGTVWRDGDGDGRQGADEAGVSGVRVNLLNTEGDVIATTTTGVDGGYEFPDLPVGSYVVEVVPPAGQSLTRPDVGDERGDSDPDWITGVTTPIVITAVPCGSGSDCPLTPPVDVDGGLIDSAVDVRISGSVSPAIVAPGASVVFAFTPGNDSSVPLPDGVRIVVTLPPGFTPGRITAPGYTTRVEGNTIVLVYTGVLLPGEQPPPFDIEAQVGSGPGTFTVEATIRARGFDLDPTPGNNLESLQVTVVRASIPQTGSEISRWLGTGSVLAASGLALVLLSRRRRRRSALETT